MGNQISKGCYLLTLLAAETLAYFYYRNCCLLGVTAFGFRLTADQSELLLILDIIAWVLLCFVLSWERERNGWYLFLSVAPPYCVHCALTYLPVLPVFTATLLLIVIASVLVYGYLFWRKKAKHRDQRSYGAVGFVFFRGGTLLFSVCLLPLVVFLLISGIRGQALIMPSIDARMIVQEDHIAAESISALLPSLQQENWQELSLQEKADIMQQIANIESARLGLYYPPAIELGQAPRLVTGAYHDDEKKIVLNIDYLYFAEQSLNTICHEIFHAYQHELAAAYDSVETEYRSLAAFQEAKAYRDGLADYQTNADGHLAYYQQEVESSARDYADLMVMWYYQQFAAQKKLQKTTAILVRKDW